MSTETFEAALTKLVGDENYRKSIEASPRRLMTDFALDPGEIGVLMQVWEKTAKDSDVVGHEMSIEVSCCCCCCC